MKEIFFISVGKDVHFDSVRSTIQILWRVCRSKCLNQLNISHNYLGCIPIDSEPFQEFTRNISHLIRLNYVLKIFKIIIKTRKKEIARL